MTNKETESQKTIIDDLDALIDILPPRIAEPLRQNRDKNELLEVVMDLGRLPTARFFNYETTLSASEVNQQDIDFVVSRVGDFGDDNRAGIERTLHRISAIRNRQGRIVGLTCRVGRAVIGTMKIIEDLVQSGKSILLLGRPGVGKTTMLREVARVLADELKKRVIIVDTSNEIAGDGDIPHPAIGDARRMQVSTPTMQHAIMIEAVENHMPEAIIIDEIGTELEAVAARTIAERGVQLVGTAHGNTMENLILNPTLSDLIGGIHTVTLGDEEARRRGTQKSILERKAPPTFDVLVEIQGFDKVAIHPDVAEVVDAFLRGRPVVAEVRSFGEKGEVHRETERVMPFQPTMATTKGKRTPPRLEKRLQLFPFGINRARLEQVAKEMHLDINIAPKLSEANILLTSKNYFRRKPQPIRDAEIAGLPIYVLKRNAPSEIRHFLDTIYSDQDKADALRTALKEAEDAIDEVINGKDTVQLNPQNSYIRRLQHLMAERFHLLSRSSGKEPSRRVEIFKS
jgi:stage III sporulation protein SpoIIIAA